MILTIYTTEPREAYPLTPTAFYLPPWAKTPAELVTFEAYCEALSTKASNEIKMDNFQLTQSKGWILGFRPILTLPAKRYAGWGDLIKQLWGGKYKEGWVHDGQAVALSGLDVIPDHLPGGGMVIVRNQTLLFPRLPR